METLALLYFEKVIVKQQKRKIKWVYMTHQSNIHVSVIAAVFEGTSVEIA